MALSKLKADQAPDPLKKGSPRVLVVDDDAGQRLLFEKSLESKFEVVLLDSTANIVARVKELKPEVILLDVNLPTGGGYEACVLLQRDPFTAQVPVVFVTSRSDTESKVVGLGIGAQDYVVKPFDPLELEARIEARLRLKRATPTTTFHFDGVHIDVLAQTLHAERDGKMQEVHLTPHEYKLLSHFVQHVDRAFSREELLDAAWGQSIHVVDRVVDTSVSAIRKKLPEISDRIETVFGHGYRFRVEKK